jgi:hypothetical protein
MATISIVNTTVSSAAKADTNCSYVASGAPVSVSNVIGSFHTTPAPRAPYPGAWRQG